MKDLTKGNPYKTILLFALPIFIGCVFQQLYNMADTVIVSHTVNAEAFTGVGLTGSVSFLILGFANGLTSGFSVRIAQRFGANDQEGVRRAIAMSYLLSIIMSAAITAIAVPITGPILRLMDISEQCYPYAYAYLFVIFCGISASVFYNIMAGVLRALGDSRTPLYCLVGAALLNVGLDFAFIVGCKLQYHGAAFATVLSQVAAGAASLIYILIRYPEYRLKKSDWKWSWNLAGGHIAVGLPMALQFSITAIGCIFQQSALNGVAKIYVGADTGYVAASKIDNLSTQTFNALGTAIATYAGQNSGAGDIKRIRKGAQVGMVYTLASAVIGLGFSVGLHRPLMNLFLDRNDPLVAAHYDEILSYGFLFLLYQSVFYLALGTIFVYRNTLQGMGKSVITMFAGVAELGGRALTSFVFVKVWGYTGFCLSNPVAWIAADLLLVTAYVVTMYRIKHGAQKTERKHKTKKHADEEHLSQAA